MTTLEMRMVALRLKGSFAPTGTLALGAGATQVDALGRPYEADYGLTTSKRVLAFRKETEAGRGPCHLVAELGPGDFARLQRAYLDMCPAQTLMWLEEERAGMVRPGVLKAELAASEPYVLGGHTGGGYFVDERRRTTVAGLWAAGDAAGGCPQKYVTGSMAEGAMAAESVDEFLREGPGSTPETLTAELVAEAGGRLSALMSPAASGAPKARELEDELQRVMDEEAGGISAGYAYDLASLARAKTGMEAMGEAAARLSDPDPREASRIRELQQRLLVARSLLAHLEARRETRWPGFGEFRDYPGIDPAYEILINSRLKNGRIEIVERDLDGNPAS
jgi:adenylylsulfate reductase subunit A